MATSDEELTVWVGGLDPQVTTEILWELFIQAGPLLEVKLPVDRETGEQRNFAFIAYKHPISGPYAQRLFNGTQLFGKVIRVRYNGSQQFDSNKYHELYEKLLERLAVDNPDKYAGIFDQIDEVKSNYIGNRIVYEEEEDNFAGYSKPPSSRQQGGGDHGYHGYHGQRQGGGNQRHHGNARHHENVDRFERRHNDYHDNRSHDNRSHDNRSHDNRSHDNRSHDNRSHDNWSRDRQNKPYQRRCNNDDSFYRQRGSRF